MTDHWEHAQRNHRAEQGDAIASAALGLLLEHGAPALTMAAVAGAANVSRQTLYRYFPDLDAVLVGVADLIARHDDAFIAHIQSFASPNKQLDEVIRTVAAAGGHGPESTAALKASLPPSAREVLDRHEHRLHELVSSILQEGKTAGTFRNDVQPDTDAPLLLGLAGAATGNGVERAINLIHQLIYPRGESS